MTPAFGCVVLTAGRRPGDLRQAVESLQRQQRVETDIIVVGNGCHPDGVPEGVRVLALEDRSHEERHRTVGGRFGSGLGDSEAERMCHRLWC